MRRAGDRGAGFAALFRSFMAEISFMLAKNRSSKRPAGLFDALKENGWPFFFFVPASSRARLQTAPIQAVFLLAVICGC